MNKKGFTLVEVIAVIAILALILILVVPGVMRSSNNSKQGAYETKVKLIEDAAVFYAQDNYSKILNEADHTASSNIYTTVINSSILFDEYLESESDTIKIKDPRDSQQDLANHQIKITIDRSTKQITADFIE